MFDVISVLNLLILVLWPNMWSIIENVSCALEENVYSVALGSNADILKSCQYCYL